MRFSHHTQAIHHGRCTLPELTPWHPQPKHKNKELIQVQVPQPKGLAQPLPVPIILQQCKCHKYNCKVRRAKSRYQLSGRAFQFSVSTNTHRGSCRKAPRRRSIPYCVQQVPQINQVQFGPWLKCRPLWVNNLFRPSISAFENAGVPTGSPPLTYTGKRFDDCICAFCTVCIFATQFLISKCNVKSSKLVGIACKFDCAPDARWVWTFDVPKFGQIAVLQKFGRTPDKFQKF